MTKVAMPPAPKSARRAGRFFRRLLVSLLLLLLLAVLALVAAVAIDLNVRPDAASYGNITYSAPDGTQLSGYLARPTGDGPHPGIIMFHEWWGLNADIVALADALATQGYVVLAPDAYRGRSANLVPSALWLVTQTPVVQIAGDLDAAFNRLLDTPGVDTARLGSIGFCFGGRQSFDLAMRQQGQLDAVVTLYGTAYTSREAMARLRPDVPILAIYGAEDNSIAVADVETMDQLMDELGLQHTVTIYDGVGHAFVSSENYNQPGPANEAWQQISAFFATHLLPASEAR